MSAGVRIDSLKFEGSLEKQGRLKTWSWKKYWFVLDDDQLAYFKDETRTYGAGLIDLGQAQSVRFCNTVPKNFSFEIVMKERTHILCTESPLLQERWVRMLQQARLLRPRRSSSMFRPRCNSISDEEIDPSDILSLDNLEPLGLPTSPPVSPAPPKSQPISPLKTPASPLKAPASRLKAPASRLKAPASPLKAPASPLKTSASPKMTPAKGTEKSNAACSPKSGWKLRRLKPAQSSTQVKLCSVKPLPDQNNSTPIITNQSEPLASQEYTLKENSIYRVEKASSNETSHQNGNKDNRAAAPVLLHSSGAQTLQNNAESVSGHSSVTSPSPSVSGQGSISRARPVTGERPSIQSRCSSKAPSISTSSGESDSSGFGDSSSRSHDTLSSSSSSSRKSEISNQSGGPIVLRRALTVSKSTAYRDSTYASSESDSDAEVDEVFCKDKPAPSAVTKYTIASTPKADMSVEEYTEYLSKTLKRIQDPIPHLPNPRLELTFRSAFDDIRLFLANNRGDDEVFPVPRQSERGGKAIKKLKACLKTVA